MPKLIRSLLLPGLLLCVAPLPVLADAIVISQAMFASTIAEYFVEEDQIRVELEIGTNDVGAFRNLLPDEIYQQFGYGEEPWAERLALFFERDLAILANDRALPGRLVSIGPQTRARRDAVTGEELASEGEEPEVVVRATLSYAFDTAPETLTLAAPRETGQATIGFVLYDRKVAVNDFRFLTGGYTVKLDWDDPWYSAFTERSLRRQYFSPMAGFIYVEPFEVRKEIIVRPADVQRLHDLGLEGVDVITPALQASVKAGIVDFLGRHFPVRIDGVTVEAEVDRVNFLERTLRSSLVVDGRDIDLMSASVGVIYSFPTDGLPQTVEMEWDLFTERMRLVPAASVDQAGPLPIFLEPGYSTLKWQNFLKFPVLPTLTDVREPPSTVQRLARWGQWLFGAIAIVGLVLLLRAWQAGRRWNGMSLFTLLLAAGLTAASAKMWRDVQMNPQRVEGLVGDLLHNVYRAFDYRGEEAVYDVLARSVSGTLLSDVYLETRKGLELANQGGAQVKVKDVELLDTRLTQESSDGFSVEAQWNVSGSIGHWGHVHQRVNGYRANITVRDVEGEWKLTELEIRQEERL